MRRYAIGLLSDEIECDRSVYAETRMPVKTITLDTEAYNRLKRLRQPNESFSDTVKRVVKEPFDVRAWLKTLQRNALSDQALDAVDEIASQRRRASARGRRRASF
jgi:predicted CopG family antitoxin